MGCQILAKRFLKHEVTFTCWCKAIHGGVKGLKDAWRLGVLYVEYEKHKKIKDQQQQKFL